MSHFAQVRKSRAILLTGLLLVTAVLAGCASTRTTPTTGLTAARVVTDVCALWTPVSYDSELDSQETVDGNRELNDRREGFCGSN